MTEHDDRICELFEESIETFLDAELDAGRGASFEAHRAGCERCTDELAWARRVRASLGELPRLEAPASTVAAVLTTARQETEARAFGRGGWSWLGALRMRPALAAIGAALLLALALVSTLDRGVDDGSHAIAQHDPTVMRATLETKLALAHVARANRRVGRGLSEDLLRERVVRPAVRSLTHSSAEAESARSGGLPVSERG